MVAVPIWTPASIAGDIQESGRIIVIPGAEILALSIRYQHAHSPLLAQPLHRRRLGRLVLIDERDESQFFAVRCPPLSSRAAIKDSISSCHNEFPMNLPEVWLIVICILRSASVLVLTGRLHESCVTIL